MNVAQRELARDLLRRADVAGEFVDQFTDEQLVAGVLVAHFMLDETAPDVKWIRDYYLLTGAHAVLTSEGWMPAECNSREMTGEDPLEVLDEVNRPAVDVVQA